MVDVNVPGLGKMPKWGIWAIALGGGLVIFYVVKKQSASSAAAAAQSTQTTAAGNTATSIDPSTGYPYGSIQDQEALSGMYGATSAYGGYGGGYVPYDYSTGTTGTTYPTNPAPTTDSAWSQEAVSLLSQEGYDPETVSGALGVYLSNGRLTQNQASIVQQAIALLGSPPQGSYPIIQQGTGAGGGGGQVTVPNVVGETAGSAHNALVSAGLTPIADPSQKPADKVTSTSPKAGAKVNPGTRVLITASPAASNDVTVPNEAGKSAGTAHNDLVHAGLVPVAPAAQKPNMKVSGTNPPAGSKVARGTHVTIKTSGYVK